MYYAIIDSESLKNPTVLNNFEQVHVTVAYEPLSDASTYHTVFLLKFSDNSVERAISQIQKEMKRSWYLFFWNTTVLHIVFDSREFLMKLPINESSKEYLFAQEFGRRQGIQDEYVNFMKYFQPYKNAIIKT